MFIFADANVPKGEDGPAKATLYEDSYSGKLCASLASNGGECRAVAHAQRWPRLCVAYEHKACMHTHACALSAFLLGMSGLHAGATPCVLLALTGALLLNHAPLSPRAVPCTRTKVLFLGTGEVTELLPSIDAAAAYAKAAGATDASSSGGLSTGAIVGIVIGCVVVVAAVGMCEWAAERVLR